MAWRWPWEPEPSDAPGPEAAPPVRRRAAKDHIVRFERALAAAEIAAVHGEKSAARVQDLHRWLDYYRRLDALETARERIG